MKVKDLAIVLFLQTDYKEHAFKMNGTFLGTDRSVDGSFDLHNKGNEIQFHGHFTSLLDKLSLMGDNLVSCNIQ